tara:strand:+ start:661 stop:1107 length:447 start_codon:yes stop_codon:yes gene_type:complete
MANRVLMGNRATGGYGLYVSQTGENVLTCNKSKLLFYTDSGETGSAFVAKGMHQAVPYSGGVGTTAPIITNSVSISSGATASVSYQNLGDDNFLYTKKGYTADASSSSFQLGLKFSSIGETGATLTSLGTGSTFGVVVFKKLSSAGLY